MVAIVWRYCKWQHYRSRNNGHFTSPSKQNKLHELRCGENIKRETSVKRITRLMWRELWNSRVSRVSRTPRIRASPRRVNQWSRTYFPQFQVFREKRILSRLTSFAPFRATPLDRTFNRFIVFCCVCLFIGQWNRCNTIERGHAKCSWNIIHSKSNFGGIHLVRYKKSIFELVFF